MYTIINKFLKLLLNENEEKGITNNAEYWKMGTSFFNTFDRLEQKIKDLDTKHSIIIELDKNKKTTEGNNETYIYKLNNDNITPAKYKKSISQSQAGQYMRAIISFGLGIIEKEFNTLKDFVEKKGEIKLVSNIKELLKQENKLELIKKNIINSLFGNIKWQKDIAYSIIIEILFEYKLDLSKLEDNNRIFRLKKNTPRNKDRNYDLNKDKDEIKKIIEKQGTIATYKEIIEIIKENYKKDKIENFFKDLDKTYEELNDEQEELNDEQDESITIKIKEQNKKDEIKRERSKFKENIFKNRQEKGLIKSKDELYSDIIEIEKDEIEQSKLRRHWDESNAAHIHPVEKIKKELKLEEESIKQISDPNNGLMMSIEYHDSFDRGQWNFDLNGHMIIHFENEEYLLKEKQLSRIKIRKEVFNEEMKKYLKKRL